MKKSFPLHSHRALKNAIASRGQASIPPGELIRLIRERLHMTQRQLAQRCRIPQSHLTLIEQGKGDVQYGTLTRILEALFCRPILQIETQKDFDSIIVDRIHQVAERRVKRTLGTMALESQEPDQETSKEMLRREERRLLHELSSEIWDDETI